MKTGIELITDERKRQVDEEGWTAEHDDEHIEAMLAQAGVCYAMADEMKFVGLYWPWDWEWWKPTTRIRDLTKAGALIAAEIDRLQRSS